MKKIFSFTKRKRGASPSASETGSLTSAGGYELRDRDLGKMHRAAYTGDLAKLRQLCKKSDPNQLDKEQRTPLHLACANGHPELVTYLVENQSKVNLCDNDSRSPLMKAVQCQQERCATILLEHNADTNLEDINGNTALHLSALIPAVALATELLEHGADVEAKNKEGCTPLHLAVCESHLDMVDFILKHSADINAKDKSGRTALMIAASNGQINLVKLLIENNADIFLKDNQGWTADDFAANNEHHACSHLIIQHGSKQRLKQSPAFHGVNIIKGGPMFGSPERVIGDGFPLGGPALDREEIQPSPKEATKTRDSGEVTDDESSQAESESRISNKAPSNTSWCSDDEEEEPQVSPQRPQKPSLAVLMNVSNQTKKTDNDEDCNNEKVHFQKSIGESSIQDQNTDKTESSERSEDDASVASSQEDEDGLEEEHGEEDGNDDDDAKCPGLEGDEESSQSEINMESDNFDEKEEAKAAPCTVEFTDDVQNEQMLMSFDVEGDVAVPCQCSIDVAYEHDLGAEDTDLCPAEIIEEESEEKECKDISEGSVKQLTPLNKTENQTQYLPSNVGTSAGRKDLMSELGLEEDDALSGFDSESSSESPREEATNPLHSCVASKQIGIIKDDQREDHSVNLLLQKPTTEAKEILKPAFTECVKNPQPDLMKELGLDDADDIEDVSDFDSSSTSPKPSKFFQESKHDNDQPDQLMVLPKEAESPLQKAAQMEFTTKHIASADEADSQTDSSKIVHDKRAQTNVSSVEKHAGPLEQTLLPQSKVEREQEPALGTLPFKGIQVELNCEDKKQEEKPALDLPKFSKKTSSGNQGPINVCDIMKKREFEAVEQNQDSLEDCSSSESDSPWEERYEKMWVDTEKKEVKYQFKTVTAELKQKFGEITETSKTTHASKDQPLNHPHESEMPSEAQSIVTSDTSWAEDHCNAVELKGAECEPTSQERNSTALNINSWSTHAAELKNSDMTLLQTLPNVNQPTTERCIKPMLNKVNSSNGTTQKGKNITIPLVIPERIKNVNGDSEEHMEDSQKNYVTHENINSVDVKRMNSSKWEPKTSVIPNNKNEIHKSEDKNNVKCCVVGKMGNLKLEPGCVKRVAQPSSDEAANTLLDKGLERDVQRFKNEVGMLQAVFLNLEKEKAQLQKEVEEEKFKSTQSRNHDETDKITMRCDAERSVVKNEGLSEKNQHLKKTLVPKATPVLKNEKGTIQPSKSVNTKETSKSAQDPCKGKNMASDGENIKDAKKNETKKISKPSSAKSLNPQQLSPSNGSNGKAHQVFDDSTISETSQDEGRSNPKLGNNRDMIARQADLPDDLEDLTLSSDTATEDCDSPSSAHRNAVLLIEQLTVEGQDTVSLIKIQNIVHEYERLIKKENGRYELLLSKVKTLESERKELQKVIEETREMKSLLEHQKVEWESDLNSVRFTLKQEEEKRKSAEMLYDKSRDQLRKKEDQCCKEMEGKQQLELNLRNLELELRTLRNSLKQVEEERSEGQRLLSQERSARVLQEGLLNSHLWKQKEEEEKKKMIVKREETLTQTSEIGEREKELSHRNHSLQEEISVLKLELDHVRTRNQEEEGKTIEENEALKERLEDLRRDLKLNEEALTQTVFQYSGQFNAMKAESALLASKVEQEKQSKERLETELESIRCRLASAIQELEHSRASKSDGERTFQRERDDWLRSQDKLNYDLANVREAHNNLSQQLTKAEAKANSLENELHRITLSLREKTLLLESTQRDLNQTQCRAKELERTLQIEKDQVSKSAVKQETLQERLAQVHSENMLLRQQLEDVQNKGILKEKAVNETQDRFSEIFSKLRDDTEKKVSMVEDRNKELITMSNDLREQIHQIESDKVKREAELRQVQQELVDALKKLCMSESCLENTIRIRTNLEEEKQRLLNEINKLESKVVDSEDRYTQSERRIQELRSMLDEKGREVMAVTQKLQEFSTLSSGTEKTVKQFEEHVQMLEIENARLEATTKQQNGKIEMLQKEHQESASVHARLEDLITNLQSTKIGLEDQLNQQVHQQTVLSQTAKDSHNLWEEELKSRSRLGVRLAQLDREKSELTEQIESERKKVKKVLDLKRSLETRLDQEMKRNTELVKEASGMKKLLKSAKKKLKEYNGGELGSSQLSTFHGELKNNQYEPENQAIRLKAKIDELSQNLEAESTKCSQLESTNRDLREQLSSVKILHKNHERLEKSKRQLEEEVANLRRHVETNMTDHNQMGQYKREIEERARQEIRQKLEEVNMFLQTQAASQETLEQIRATNDASLRNQMEHRIRDLESELSRIKSTQQDSMCQKESTQTELDRYKDLYSEEIKIRKSLAAKLDRANERLAEANTKLLTERQRSKSLIANSFVNGSLSPSPFMDTSQLGTNLAFNRSLGFGGNFLAPVGNGMSSNNRVEAYLAKMQRELEKNITKELDQANAELESGSRLSPVGSTTGSLRNITGDQDPVSRATQQYLEVLKKNSKI
ncbi:ankyrin repeat domain-containing protein 26 isoform X2 [Ambystoma mexicanum]|uniref:ankyrin repeat domain-containing protein 26 isoform X2 n=1 Tax=Ambystoma mexicanum TaxID=8296 RepID=UPI0037E819A5